MSYSIPGAGGVSSVNGKTGPVTLVPSDLGAAPLASPALTGTPTAPTPATGDASTLLATTAHVAAKIAANAPGLAPVQSVAGRTGAVVVAPADLAVPAGANAIQGGALDAVLRGLDALVMPAVKGIGVNAPPGSPASGDAYVVGTAPSGAWTGKANQIARWSATLAAWEFYIPNKGWNITDGSVTGTPFWFYTGTAWTQNQQIGNGASSVMLSINGAAGQVRDIYFNSNGSLRWIVRCSNDAESGSSAGSNFQIMARDDAGAWIDVPLTIARAAGGIITLSRKLSVVNGINFGQSDLKNYQEGTWTPTLPTGWTNTGTPYLAGYYRRIGNWVRCVAFVGGSSAGGTGTVSFAMGATMGGLPFTPANLANGGFASGNIANQNGGGDAGKVFVSGATAYLIGTGTANAYAYCLMFDFFI